MAVLLLLTDIRSVCCDRQSDKLETVCNYWWNGYGAAGAGVVQEAAYCDCHTWQVVDSYFTLGSGKRNTVECRSL